MNIPSTFQLGGLTWKVKRIKKFKDKTLCGDTNIAQKTIRILDTLEEDIKEQTFCHELVHAIKFSMGKSAETHDEEDTDAFAMFLHQFLNTAE